MKFLHDVDHLGAEHPHRVQLGHEQGEELEGGGGGELPVQLLQDQHLHVLQLRQGAAAVCSDDKFVQTQWPGI